MDETAVIAAALEEADRGFEEAVARLIDLVGDDAAVLSSAASRLAATTRAADTTEHIAFTYLAAAFRRIADQRSAYPRAR